LAHVLANRGEHESAMPFGLILHDFKTLYLTRFIY